LTSLDYSQFFTFPEKHCYPSVFNQVIWRPLAILDPYILALERNYYYPLTMMESATMEETTHQTSTISSPKPRGTAQVPEIITVEHSLYAISKLLNKFEDDEPPTQPTLLQVNINQQKNPSSYRHCFAMYRKSTGGVALDNPTVQLHLFKSFAKSIKSADMSAQILPMRNDIKIHPLSTSDHITNLDMAGITSYCKPYKHTKKT